MSLEPSPNSLNFHFAPVDNTRLANLCGQFDEHLRLVERRLGVEINNRGEHFQVLGDHKFAVQAGEVLERLYKATENEVLSPQVVHLVLRESGMDNSMQAVSEDDINEVIINTRKGTVRGRGDNQKQYLKNIMMHDINFGIGPAGTGKTYLAVACAVDALEKDLVRRIILTRPAVEAGERLGFLPGDLTQKIDPYLRPLYDALYEMLGFERVAKLLERNVIEIAPLAYMRGRTLNEAFIILDEAQNTTLEQMKMFLTRIGFGSTAIVTGDITQIDLPGKMQSGLRQVIDVLDGVKGLSFNFFKARDVVRHELVQRIVTAYDLYDEQNVDS
ncbi:Phosphate starvation-inducible protein PhoH, predicted ATPase [hydrothermal vent metagenome]|uniref:PhoH-like protein n=1 Tax=hydrothermal vent metagenome TaxID=652676 RepID=A0A3B0Y5P2_9ZZZZ